MNEKQPIAPELVQEFVGNAHGNLARVQELLQETPNLLNASWDWGDGDWENGLEAAAHMGNRPIALFLLASGARLNIFAAAMLGEVEIVRAMLTAHPEMRDARGAHGIPLLAHAMAGGEDAVKVVAILDDAAVPG